MDKQPLRLTNDKTMNRKARWSNPHGLEIAAAFGILAHSAIYAPPPPGARIKNKIDDAPGLPPEVWYPKKPRFRGAYCDDEKFIYPERILRSSRIVLFP